MYVLYSAAMLLLFAVATPYFLCQWARHGKYAVNLPERLGALPVALNLDREPSIWIQTVSVGEALTARPIAAGLKERYPHLRLYVSTTTITGQQVARDSFPMADGVFYFPIDLPVIVRRVLGIVRPRLFVMMETEIWPNLLRECRARGVRTVLVNGRVSARSFPRYRLVRPLFRRVLASVDLFCVQGPETAQRLIALGAPPGRIAVTGSLKFDALHRPGSAQPSSRAGDRVLRFFRVAAGRAIIVAGSTMPGEHEIVLAALERVRTLAGNPLLVLAPRRPEHFGDAEARALERGFKTVRRSALTVDEEVKADVVILDTIGELAEVYQIATAVFVGGSLVNIGGHNILEPAAFGKPVVFGPHMQNFAEIASAFLEDRAAEQVRSGRELEDALIRLLADPAERERMGAAARAIVEANRGATARTLDAIAGILPPAGAERVLPFPGAR
ncbi:MAG TPA: 3-deoxy-D-manno-octulosonic acid transferase [Vicinamibacterales bacterium]|nr:3-deoxy-D-manno-octulosonic acid transferase [Vicinamibacterales bacterium]HPW21657.1 3-deoxy-D-manno-octulosonic acid transferase [Vicinamibacterales bacterium]